MAETGDKKPCPFCGKTDVYRAYIEDGSMGDWCPHCQRSIPKIEEPQVIEESPDKKLCPYCGKRVVIEAYVEDGGMGDWCPLCKKSIPRKKREPKLTTKWLTFYSYSRILFILSHIYQIVEKTIYYDYYIKLYGTIDYPIPIISDLDFYLKMGYIFFIHDVFDFVTVMGLIKRKLWAWKLNFILIILPAVSYISFMIIYYYTYIFYGKQITYHFQSPLTFILWLFIPTFLIVLTWIWPNIIYFKKRKRLFT